MSNLCSAMYKANQYLDGVDLLDAKVEYRNQLVDDLREDAARDLFDTPLVECFDAWCGNDLLEIMPALNEATQQKIKDICINKKAEFMADEHLENL